MPSVHAQRLLIVAATIELAVGIALFASPGSFKSALYAPLIPLLPRLSALFLSGGLLLLVAVRYRPAAWVRRLLATAAALPLLLFAFYIGSAGGYVGRIAYLILAGGLVVAPWTHTVDIFAITLGLAHLSIGLTLFGGSFLVLSPSFDAIRPVLVPVGLIGLGGAALFLVPPVRSAVPASWRRVGILILPAILAYSFWRSGTWSGLIVWLTWLFAALLESHPLLTGLLTSSRSESSDPDDAWAASGERSVEVWSWTMTLLVVGVMTVLEPAVSQMLPKAVLFTALVGGYNVLFGWLLPPIGTPVTRLFHQLAVLAVGTGLLNVDGSLIAAAILPVLAAIPMVAARAGGSTHGCLMLALVLAALPLGHLTSLRMGLNLAEHPNLLVQMVTLGATGIAGVWISSDQRRLFRQLAQASRSLEQSNAELQQANEELYAQREQLSAQQDDLMHHHRTLVEQALTLSCQRDELLESESRFRAAFENAPIGMALVGLDLVILRANPALDEMLGYGPGQLAGMSIRQITHPEEIRSRAQALEDMRDGRSDEFTLESRFLHRDGRSLWVAVNVAVVRDSHLTPLYLIAQVVDVTERRRSEQQLRQLANYDPLTGLANRRLFQERIEAALGRPEGKGALLFLDLDQFKYVNDTLGHRAGDDLLQCLAAVLGSALEGRGLAARLGGDEFGILMEDCAGAKADAVAAEILAAVQAHTADLGEHPVGVTASIGVALYPEHGRTVDELTLHADLAMYQAKNGGRNRYRRYTPNTLQVEMGTRLNWERRIREALAEDRFVLEFQPILDLNQDEVIMYEALLRMAEPDGRLIPPGEFLGVAEASGLIHEIDRWVAQRAIATMAEQQARGRHISLSVNLSAYAFTNRNLLTLIRDGIEANQIEPERLRFEITESAAIDDMDAAASFISALTALGCGFAVDDFGVGFSSLNYLKRLPVGALKIDGGFIERLAESPVDQNLVKAMVTMAKGMGLRTVAEYVGSEETVALLRQCGVDAAQGFHIGRPGPLPE